MVKLTIRNITAHKRRLLATSLAVILGVAFLTATLDARRHDARRVPHPDRPGHR